MKKNKAFTLIELVSVLVILAILALIVTPLVLNIIRKARIAADKRSIDAYGRSIELAVADYLLETGTFPTSIEELQVEYSGDRVVCSTAQLNEDSSVYLTGCTVAGRNIDYSYGTDKTSSTSAYKAYEVGDEVTYNNVNYYVIKDSTTSEAGVTLLKAEPLTTTEVNTYGGVGTANNHVNRFYNNSQAYDNNGYGGMVYYSSDICKFGSQSGCTSNYEESEIKYVVDAWALEKTNEGDLLEDSNGYKTRLLTYEELTTSLGYTLAEKDITNISLNNETVPNWVYSNDYRYCTMSAYNDSTDKVWYVFNDGKLGVSGFYDDFKSSVRPVITIKKSALN